MAVAIRGTTPAFTSNSGVDPTSLTLNGTRQPQAGDVLIIIHSNNFYTLANIQTPTVGGSTTGVVSIVNADGGSNGAHAKSFYYVVGATGDLTVAEDESPNGDEEKGLVVYVLSGVDTANPIAASAAATNTGGTTHIAPSVSPAMAGAFLICHANVGGGTGPASYTSPGSMTEQYDSAVTGWCMVGATEQLSASGATGTRTFTPVTSETVNCELSIAVAPAGGGAAATDGAARFVSPVRLPGRIGPDRNVFLPRPIDAGAFIVSGGPVSLDGVGSTSTSATADAAVALAAVGVGSVSTFGTAAGRLAIPVAGMGANSTGVAADLQLPVLLAGVGANSVNSPAVMVAALGLAGKGANSTQAPADMRAAWALAGIGSVSTFGTAAVRLAQALAGVGANAVAGDDALRLALAFAGIGPNSVQGKADLTIQGQVSLAGAAGVSTGAQAAARLAQAFAGMGANSVQSPGVLNVLIPIAGIGSVSTGSGNAQLNAIRALAGHGDVATSGTAAVVLQYRLSGSGSVAVYAIGDMTTEGIFVPYPYPIPVTGTGSTGIAVAGHTEASEDGDTDINYAGDTTIDHEEI